ncbi:MAG: metallophosphoesterase family protein [Arenicella sp.]
MKRRTVIKALAGITALVGIPYSLWRGVRYPRLSLETPPLKDSYSFEKTDLKFVDCFVTQNDKHHPNNENSNNTIFLRAFAPEPSIIIQQSAQARTLHLNNISAEAKLTIQNNSTIKEKIDGINRIISIPATQEEIVLNWTLPEYSSFEFAAIGDTGGAEELEWCIHRAAELNAKFFIHLGDFNYQDSDYDSAVQKFRNAPLPCYITIGNHDFHDNGLIVEKFLDDLGPLNNTFNVGNTRFVNIDTAASFLPVSGGKRAQMTKALIKDSHNYDDSVVFTHRSFYDPRPGEDHDLGNVFEKDWFVKSLKAANMYTLLAGHIHQFHDVESEGIRIIIAGQGLAHEDLIHQRQTAKMLIGNVSQGQKVAYRTEPLSMPFNLHCHPHSSKWRKDNNDPFAEKINSLCEPIDARINKA